MSRIAEALTRVTQEQPPAAAPAAPWPAAPAPPAVAPRANGEPLDQYVHEAGSVPPAGGPESGLQHFGPERGGSDVNPVVIPPRPATTARRARVTGIGAAGVALDYYGALAATLHEAQAERGLKTVMVTSAAPREGKTLTVVNLALTLSESYRRRVLLIDADLRFPSVHKVLRIPNTAGLSEVLASPRLVLPLVHVSEDLAVLPAGRPEPDPLGGLSSDRMPALLDECARQFDWVLLDAPPVVALPDTQLLARLAQAVVFVIRAGATPFASVERAIEEIGRECIIGTVLNSVDENQVRPDSHYGYGRRPADSAS